MKENILVVHGGAPTAVMNASLYGVIREAEKYPNIDHIYAAIGGSGGILKEHFLDLKTIEKDKIESLPYTRRLQSEQAEMHWKKKIMNK